MIKKFLFLRNLDYLSRVLYILNLNYATVLAITENSSLMLKTYNLIESSLPCSKSKKKTDIHYLLDIISIIQYLLSIVCESKLQKISLVILLESRKFYPTYNNYLRKYKAIFRQYSSKNFVGNYYYSDNCIDIIALSNLRIILLCSNTNGIYVLWLYLIHHSCCKSN